MIYCILNKPRVIECIQIRFWVVSRFERVLFTRKDRLQVLFTRNALRVLQSPGFVSLDPVFQLDFRHVGSFYVWLKICSY